MPLGTKKKWIPRTRDYAGEAREQYKPVGDSELASLYKDITRDEGKFEPKHLLPDEEEEFEPEEEPKIVRVHSRESIPREDKDEIEPLRRISPLVIGNLFDRVRFLEERIKELNDALALRNKIHDEIVKELDTEIDEKHTMLLKIIEPDDLRDLKLDISMLRGQKRREAVQFWRDNLELHTELRTISEQHETEKKIAGLFREMDGA